MANIKEIAKLAGVSVSTVSRVLNNHPYVREDKRTRVLE
ncbi:LacI family DNA-binding transcriptional regulator, partial [Clostridium perfringens]